MDIGTVIKRPFSDLKTMALGSLACIIPGFAFGYGLKCAKNRNESLPDLSDFGEILVQGLLGLVIAMIWSIPAVIAMFVTVGSVIIAMLGATAKNSAGGMMGALGGMGIGMLIFLALLLVTMYVLPVALLNFGKHGFGGGFALGSIFKIAFTSEYFMAWLIATVLGFAFGVAGWIVSAVLTMTIILAPVGFLASLVSLFGTTVVMYTLLGEAYDKLAD